MRTLVNQIISSVSPWNFSSMTFFFLAPNVSSTMFCNEKNTKIKQASVLKKVIKEMGRSWVAGEGKRQFYFQHRKNIGIATQSPNYCRGQSTTEKRESIFWYGERTRRKLLCGTTMKVISTEYQEGKAGCQQANNVCSWNHPFWVMQWFLDF